MIAFILDQIISPFWPYILTAGGFVVAFLTGRMGGAAKAKAKQAAAQAKADKESHERMNDADLGIGATDSERIDRLRDFAAKHGNRPAKGPGSGLR